MDGCFNIESYLKRTVFSQTAAAVFMVWEFQQFPVHSISISLSVCLETVGTVAASLTVSFDNRRSTIDTVLLFKSQPTELFFYYSFTGMIAFFLKRFQYTRMSLCFKAEETVTDNSCVTWIKEGEHCARLEHEIN